MHALTSHSIPNPKNSFGCCSWVRLAEAKRGTVSIINKAHPGQFVLRGVVSALIADFLAVQDDAYLEVSCSS